MRPRPMKRTRRAGLGLAGFRRMLSAAIRLWAVATLDGRSVSVSVIENARSPDFWNGAVTVPVTSPFWSAVAAIGDAPSTDTLTVEPGVKPWPRTGTFSRVSLLTER